MAKKKTQKNTPGIAFGVFNKPAVVENKPAVAQKKAGFIANILPKMEFGKIISINKSTATFIASGVFWSFESTDRFDIDASLIDCDAALTSNFGISFSYSRSKDEKTYELFVSGIHIVTLHHSHNDNDPLQMRIEEFEEFEIKTSANAQMMSLGSEGNRIVEKTKNGVVTYRREDYGK